MGQHPFQNFMVRFASGDRIFSEGEVGKTMYIVQSGRVSLTQDLNGEQQAVGVLERGDFFGEMSILEGLPRTMTAEATENAELIEINSTIFDKMIRGNIEIAIRMLRKLSLRLRDAERKLVVANANGSAASATASPVQQAATSNRPVEVGVRLEVPDQSVAYAVGNEETLIGRYDPVTELKPDIDLTDMDLKRTVSRRHARIVQTDEGYVLVEEVGALNGTFVNGAKLVAGQGQPIADGDKLGVGAVAMIFRT
jgi:CRP-like cAMP-binding protein